MATVPDSVMRSPQESPAPYLSLRGRSRERACRGVRGGRSKAASEGRRCGRRAGETGDAARRGKGQGDEGSTHLVQVGVVGPAALGVKALPAAVTAAAAVPGAVPSGAVPSLWGRRKGGRAQTCPRLRGPPAQYYQACRRGREIVRSPTHNPVGNKSEQHCGMPARALARGAAEQFPLS